MPPAALANKTPAIEVMNADSGPGTNIGITDPTAAGLAAYQAAITTAHAYGSRVYGYIWTNYANAGSGRWSRTALIAHLQGAWVPERGLPVRRRPTPASKRLTSRCVNRFKTL